MMVYNSDHRSSQTIVYCTQCMQLYCQHARVLRERSHDYYCPLWHFEIIISRNNLQTPLDMELLHSMVELVHAQYSIV